MKTKWQDRRGSKYDC